MLLHGGDPIQESNLKSSAEPIRVESPITRVIVMEAVTKKNKKYRYKKHLAELIRTIGIDIAFYYCTAMQKCSRLSWRREKKRRAIMSLAHRGSSCFFIAY